MKDIEGYVTPPPYDENTKNNCPLIAKLEKRIQQDINQIKGVYQTMISDAERWKIESISDINEEHDKKVEKLTKQMEAEIEKYNSNATKHIDNLINEMNKPEEKPNWAWNYFIGDWLNKLTDPNDTFRCYR